MEFGKKQTEEEYEEIIRLMLKVKSSKLKSNHPIKENIILNGLQKFSCECCIYTYNNIFYVQAPHFNRDVNSEYWDIGFLDVKNVMFYELGVLITNKFEKNLFFSEWTTFLQILIDNKIYSKLFNYFGFDKAHLIANDRNLPESSFFNHLKPLLNDEFSDEFLIYLLDLFKTQNTKLVSFNILKKKISANLKNFRENLKLTSTNSIK